MNAAAIVPPFSFSGLRASDQNRHLCRWAIERRQGNMLRNGCVKIGSDIVRTR